MFFGDWISQWITEELFVYVFVVLHQHVGFVKSLFLMFETSLPSLACSTTIATFRPLLSSPFFVVLSSFFLSLSLSSLSCSLQWWWKSWWRQQWHQPKTKLSEPSWTGRWRDPTDKYPHSRHGKGSNRQKWQLNWRSSYLSIADGSVGLQCSQLL